MNVYQEHIGRCLLRRWRRAEGRSVFSFFSVSCRIGYSSSSFLLNRSGATSAALPLHQASWMRYHPVEKLSILGRIGAAGPHLLEEPKENPVSHSGNLRYPHKSTEKHDSRGSSTSLKDEPERPLWFPPTGHLSYSGRLQIALSLLLWVRGLRDVQDTIARLHLPYAPTHRVTRGDGAGALVAFPFPTRRVERWVDPFTSVELRLHPKLNPMGEQVPAPHTWDPENSVSFDDIELEENVIAEMNTHHGDKGSRETRIQRLQRVQGLSRLPSNLDDAPDRRAKKQAAGLQVRRRRRGVGHQQQCSSGLGDAGRGMPPVSFQSEEDMRYHGNLLRGECCPLNEEGVASAVSISVELSDDQSRRDEASLVAGCIKAHVAIMSSLFVEGRTVAFSTNDPVVLSYVQYIFGELIENYAAVMTQLSCTPVRSTSSNSDISLPYFPLWSTREVLVLVPPLQPSGFSTAEVNELAATILQSVVQGDTTSAPLTIVVESDDKLTDSSVYLAPLKRTVNEKLHESGFSEKKIKWMPLPPPCSESSSTNGKTISDPARKRIQRFTEGVAGYSEHLYAVQLLHTSTNSLLRDDEIDRLVWHQLSVNTRLVGINTSVWHTLFYYPQAAFLSHKVGNVFRYRAVERSLIRRRSHPSLISDPIAWALGRGRGIPSLPAFHCGLPLLTCKYYANSITGPHDVQSPTTSNTTTPFEHKMSQCFLLCERLVDYLANPTAVSLLALFSARLFGL